MPFKAYQYPGIKILDNASEFPYFRAAKNIPR